MRKRALLAVLAISVVIPSGAMAQARVSQPAASARKAPLTKCAVTKTAVTAAGQLFFKGWCKQGKKPVKAAPVIVKITGTDGDGYACQVVAKGAGTKFALVPAGMAQVAGTVRYLPKAKHGRVVSKARQFGAKLTGSLDLQCGTRNMVKNLPGDGGGALCNQAQWPPIGWTTGFVAHCAFPAANACVFAGVMFNRDPVTGDVSVPHVVCQNEAGYCTYVHDTVAPYSDGVGGLSYSWHLACPGGVGAEVFMLIEGANSSGQFCQWAGTAHRTAGVPLSRAGKLYLAAAVVTYGNYDRHSPRVGEEDLTGSLVLTPSGPNPVQELC